MTGSSKDPVFPGFMFERRPWIEEEAGYLLAGQLIVDIPDSKSKKLKRKHRQMIEEIVRMLVDDATSGAMPKDAVLTGWRGGKPENAVDIKDVAVMTAWAKRSYVITLRVNSPADGDTIVIDSDVRRQMGLLDS